LGVVNVQVQLLRLEGQTAVTRNGNSILIGNEADIRHDDEPPFFF
jgi:hypothetical protein